MTELVGVISSDANISGVISAETNVAGMVIGDSVITGMVANAQGGGGTMDYMRLKNKPKLESVELIGDKSFEDLGVSMLTNHEISSLL